ncbi:NAD(P)-dependent oxidoreductase [Microbacterium protaetiae]|uniref:NAD(P)-dependent oxidoreductase n=1 Tax=Microbacterium protaetiae TaxID=2509458 RepID=A0A4P6EL95_9MICO|nr:NAD(P)-dependent oxidoreductase [Microbacterium protaetiae]QAY60977.1 NAD(P)-dependent oxidoreductase [Microbacterium protaetiae]
MARIVILHPGAMGAAVGRAVHDAGHDVGWIAEARSPATADRAAAAGLHAWSGVDEADVVISLVPPAVALATARSVAGFAGVYIDANAISPARAAEVAGIVRSGGAEYVDASVVGPPPVQEGTTRLYLSGSAAPRAAELFAQSRLEPVVLDGVEYAASALKMAYASWTKISAALVLAAEGTARAHGVADALHAEWRRSQPDLEQRGERAAISAEQKGWRWVDEMRQIAETFDAAGEPAGFGDAAAAVYKMFPRP